MGDIANVYDGTHTTPDYQKNGIMFLSVENIDTLTSNKFITKSDYLDNYKHKPEYHDIFMTRIGSIGKTNILETHDPRAFYVSLALIKPKDIDPYYLKYWLSSNTTQKEIWRRTLQIAFPQKINKNEISKVQSSISKSKNEQYNMGQLLNKIDHLLLLQQRKLEQLELLQKSILQTIFTSNNKKEKIELNKLANYRRGSFPQPYTNKKWYGGKNSKPFVQVIDVNDNLKLHEQTKERISEMAQPKSVFVPKGSIIVTLQGSIGRVAITQYDSYVDRTLLILTDFKKKIDKYYFANALKMVFNKEKLKAPGGTIKTITKSTLSSFKIVLPNIKLQIQYGKLLKSVDKQIILNKNRIMKLKKIKQFLLQNIFI